MITIEQTIQSPFRRDKFNVAPDDELCKTCGKCCTHKFGYLTIIPLDFEDDYIEEGLRSLMQMDRLFIKLINASHDGGYYIPIFLLLGKCCFLGENGCILSADERPIACGHFGPKRFTKKGKPIKKIRCDFISSDWLTQLVIDKVGSQYAFWELESWRGYEKLLCRLFNELPNNRKIELSRSSWGISIVNPYESAGILYTETKKNEEL